MALAQTSAAAARWSSAAARSMISREDGLHAHCARTSATPPWHQLLQGRTGDHRLLELALLRLL